MTGTVSTTATMNHTMTENATMNSTVNVTILVVLCTMTVPGTVITLAIKNSTVIASGTMNDTATEPVLAVQCEEAVMCLREAFSRNHDCVKHCHHAQHSGSGTLNSHGNLGHCGQTLLGSRYEAAWQGLHLGQRVLTSERCNVSWDSWQQGLMVMGARSHFKASWELDWGR